MSGVYINVQNKKVPSWIYDALETANKITSVKEIPYVLINSEGKGDIVVLSAYDFRGLQNKSEAL